MSSDVASILLRLSRCTRNTVSRTPKASATAVRMSVQHTQLATGHIVRITPDELHINDVDYYEEVYPGSHKPTDKSPASSGAFGKHVPSRISI